MYDKYATHIPTKFQEELGSFYVLEVMCILMLLCIGIVYWRNR